MSKQTNYYKVGVFTLCCFALLVVSLIVLGAGAWNDDEQYAETYFDESVQGLSVGSPVKYRGVSIGEVAEIDSLSNVYDPSKLSSNMTEQERRYIYVKFSLNPELKSLKSQDSINQLNSRYITEGLRVSLATADLVGNVYLEMNFVDPQKNPALSISWKPRLLYIPSAQSSLARFTDSIDKILTRMTEADMAGAVNNFSKFMASAQAAIDKADLPDLLPQLTTTLKQVGNLSETIDKTISSDKGQDLYDSLLRDSKLLEETLQDVSSAMRQLNAFASRTNQLTAGQQQGISDALSALKQMSRNLEVLSASVKNDPSSLVFGQPTQPVDPSK